MPVVEALEALGCLPTTNSSTQGSTHVRPHVLVHSFSNGMKFKPSNLLSTP